MQTTFFFCRVATSGEQNRNGLETFMSDSKKMRADNTRSLEDKTSAKADAIGALETHSDNMGVASKKKQGCVRIYIYICI